NTARPCGSILKVSLRARIRRSAICSSTSMAFYAPVHKKYQRSSKPSHFRRDGQEKNGCQMLAPGCDALSNAKRSLVKYLDPSPIFRHHSDSLNFDQSTRAGEAGNGDEGTGRKIFFRKHLTPNLYKAVAVADIGDEYRHG